MNFRQISVVDLWWTVYLERHPAVPAAVPQKSRWKSVTVAFFLMDIVPMLIWRRFTSDGKAEVALAKIARITNPPPRPDPAFWAKTRDLDKVESMFPEGVGTLVDIPEEH